MQLPSALATGLDLAGDVVPYAVAGLLLLLLAALALVGLQHTIRGTPLTRVAPDADEPLGVCHPGFAPAVALLAGTQLVSCDGLTILADGEETFPALWADLRAATASISLQAYYAKPGRVADELAEILGERARAGVRVRVLFDGFGARQLLGDYARRLRAAGVQVTGMRPLRVGALHRAQRRSHVRLVVVDGRVAYTGGFGLADQWRGDGRHSGRWRDTNVRVEGTVALQFQAAFAAAWTEATGELLLDGAFLPGVRGWPPAPDGGPRVGLLYAAPSPGSTAAERFLAASIAGARHRLYVTNSYFAPTPAFVRLLVDAAQRGVDVRLLTASARSDVPTVYHAGRARYDRLLAGGVRIWEYRPAMVHAKTLVADGAWSTVGSLSFDNRGLALNDESTLLIADRAVATRLEALFLEDQAHADEVRLDAFRRRSWRERALERAASAANRLL